MTSELTQVSYTTVQKIIQNPNFEKRSRPNTEFSKIDVNLDAEIRNTKYQSYKGNFVQTMKNVMEELAKKSCQIKYQEETFRKSKKCRFLLQGNKSKARYPGKS